MSEGTSKKGLRAGGLRKGIARCPGVEKDLLHLKGDEGKML